jgi:ferrochelatase
MARAEAAAGGRLELRFVRQWHESELYLSALGMRVRVALAHLPAGSEVLFTAHSLPARILETGDPYPEQLKATAAAVAEHEGVTRWRVAWQSAGRTPEPWLGPDVLEVLDELAAANVPGVLVCPAGFVSDHLEILYDLDIEARTRAEGLGLAFARTPSLNDDPKLCAALAGAVLDALD